MPDFGSDLAGVDDIRPDLSESDGLLGLGEALATRLIQPKGGVVYDPENGYDTRALLSAEVIPRGAQQAIAAQLQGDERVEAVQRVDITRSADGETLEIKAEVMTADGPFRLTLDPADASSAVFEETT